MRKNFGNMGCLIAILVFILLISIFRVGFYIIFRTPVGLVLLAAYLFYRYFYKKKQVEEEEHFEFKQDKEVVDVDYEDLD